MHYVDCVSTPSVLKCRSLHFCVHAIGCGPHRCHTFFVTLLYTCSVYVESRPIFRYVYFLAVLGEVVGSVMQTYTDLFLDCILSTHIFNN